MGIVRQLKSPVTLNVHKIFSNDFFFNLIYILIVNVYAKKTGTLYMFPLALHFLLGVSNYIVQNQQTFGFLMKQPKFYALMHICTGSKEMLMEVKGVAELGLGLYFFALAALGKFDPLVAAAYPAYLGYRYYMSESMKGSIRFLKGAVNT
eukprot:CAMPEP_0114584542 /NCGR_PEP_ID=MMETSP0125-20121206/8225_1 /TAXON_ID=485358 ORGANISM="Aristerostoma sp., Strain ATCC 50986" /NCGR_SAMPLE_ID=MMETSP0125 /ASSEMBLY_ACC=CAM_ASM_000245 /LENGTH=149 /DNA_ID=CAMNT_0001779003 /DNA_START=481 /DNA_END=926 /DNA_ORIENTATION=-